MTELYSDKKQEPDDVIELSDGSDSLIKELVAEGMKAFSPQVNGMDSSIDI
jgi:hypothetical protein